MESSPGIGLKHPGFNRKKKEQKKRARTEVLKKVRGSRKGVKRKCLIRLDLRPIASGQGQLYWWAGASMLGVIFRDHHFDQFLAPINPRYGQTDGPTHRSTYTKDEFVPGKNLVTDKPTGSPIDRQCK